MVFLELSFVDQEQSWKAGSFFEYNMFEDERRNIEIALLKCCVIRKKLLRASETQDILHLCHYLRMPTNY